jgi:hypothetical protein
VIPSHDTRQGEELRYAFCADLWRAAPAEMRIPLLIETLERYRNGVDIEIEEAPTDDPVATIRSGKGLNDLIISAYRLASGREGKKLSMVPDEAQSLEILRTAYHYCGHGEDTTPPLRFALRHFRGKLYSNDFLDALSAYRECLSHTRQTATQRIRAEIDLILWQDFRRPSDCWTERIRCGLGRLRGLELARWRSLFQRFCYSSVPSPPRHWRVEDAVDSIGRERCASMLLEWIDRPTAGRPMLTAPGSVVLKNLVWLAAELRCEELDRSLHHTLFLPWRKTQPLDKMAVALAWLWSVREDRAGALRRISEILGVFGGGGQEIRRFWMQCGGGDAAFPGDRNLI